MLQNALEHALRLLLLISVHGELAESSVSCAELLISCAVIWNPKSSPLLTWVQVDISPNWKEPQLPLKSSIVAATGCALYTDNKQLRLLRGNTMQCASACTTLKTLTACLIQFMCLLLPLSQPCKLPCRTFNRHCSFRVAVSSQIMLIDATCCHPALQCIEFLHHRSCKAVASNNSTCSCNLANSPNSQQNWLWIWKSLEDRQNSQTPRSAQGPSDHACF